MKRTLLHHPGAHQGTDRSMATGIQRGKTKEGTEGADSFSLCKTTGSAVGYSNHRTLNPTATENGGTSIMSADTVLRSNIKEKSEHVLTAWSCLSPALLVVQELEHRCIGPVD